jgi:hypothetical protein
MDFMYSKLPDGNLNSSQNGLVNKAFSLLGVHELFTKHGWHLSQNNEEQFCYTKRSYELNIFEVTIQKDKIYVSVPIFNSPFQYKTYFTDYTSAYNYIEQKFYDLND